MQKDFAAPEGRRFTVTAATTLVSQLGDFAFLLSATWLITFPASGCHSVSVPESIAHQYVMTLEDAPFSSDAYFVWSAMHLNQHECIAWGSGGAPCCLFSSFFAAVKMSSVAFAHDLASMFWKCNILNQCSDSFCISSAQFASLLSQCGLD